MASLQDYTVVIRPDEGTFVAYVPAIEGCHAIGRTPSEAQAELVSVFEMIAEEYAEKGQPLPPDVAALVVHGGSRAEELEKAARRLGFVKARQKGSHARWVHADGRATTIPIHPSQEIGGARAFSDLLDRTRAAFAALGID